jgi:hypothetical protein
VTENGIILGDLAAGYFCEECGRAKSYRLWPGVLTGCKTCDEVVTRHRCTKRPDLATGESWTCPDCGTAWTAREEEETCGECGQGIGTMGRTWDVDVGDRIGTAPRRDPPPCTPFRDLFSLPAARVTRPGPFGECYKTASGMQVHVRPGCRCR